MKSNGQFVIEYEHKAKDYEDVWNIESQYLEPSTISSVEQTIDWNSKNSDTHIFVRDLIKDKIVGEITFLPLSKEQFDKFMNGELEDTEIDGDSLLNYENEDLNEVGLKQAEELKSRISDIDHDIIISSPLVRVKHTAEIINVKNKSIIIDKRLEERNPGDLNGKPISYTNREEYWNFNSKVQYGTSENMKSFFNRVFNFLDELKEKDYNSVLIAAHSGVSKAFSAYFQGINDGKFLEHGLKNCEIREYEL